VEPDSPRWRERLFVIGASVVIAGLAAWLFGNVYEEIVIVPNFVFGDVHAAMIAFRTLFRTTNPVFYYAAVGPLVVLSTGLTTFAAWREPRRRARLLLVLACVGLAGLLSVYIVIGINLRLFFGPVFDDDAVARGLAVQWLVLNLLRVALVATAMTLAVRARTEAPRAG
jgi:hypothetical protein